MLIRPETASDIDAIHELTRAAFEPMSYADGSEPWIIRALRKNGDLVFSLVAEENGEIIGHVAFSPVQIEDAEGDWYGLGPISVRNDRQRQGVGGRLIRAGLEQLKGLGASGCALIGDPNYYGRFSFVSGALRYGDLDAKYVQYIVLQGRAPAGALAFASGFNAKPPSA